MTYRLAILGESRAQLESTLLREWLKRAGFSVCSCWPNDQPSAWKAEDVCFITSVDDVPEDTPLLTLGQYSAHCAGGPLPPILKIRGSVLPRQKGGWFVATLDPRALGPQGGQDELRPLLGADAQRAIASARGPCVPNVTFLETPSLLSCEPPRDAIVSVDIEGANGRPNIVGVSWSEGEAFVFPWGDDLRVWLTSLFETHTPTFHNGAYDVPELELAGVEPPRLWVDSINLAALYEPDLPKNLQFQVLAHVPGSVTWKGLVSHEHGPDYEDVKVKAYRQLWTRILSRLDKPVPATGSGWYQWYNCLDTAWGLALTNQLTRKLKTQKL